MSEVKNANNTGPQYYVNGTYKSICPHCCWVTQTRRKNSTNPDILFLYAKDHTYVGLTVFDARNYFKNTFNCITYY